MPALKSTTYVGELIWIGAVPDRQLGLPSVATADAELRFSGLVGEDHGGETRTSCSRVRDQYPVGTEIRNTRQVSILSEEELAQIARNMGISTLAPELVGATMVVRGLPDFTHIPPASRLQFGGGATVTVDMENRPCALPAKPIEAVHPGMGKLFRSAAIGLRGVTAWVEREGRISLGDAITLHVPDQRVWQP